MKKTKATEPISSVALLQARIARKYEDFKDTMLELDNETLFELAPTITAVREVFKYTIHGDCLEELESAYLLRYENPLKVLADAWKQFNESDEYQLYDLIGDIVAEDDDGEDDYMTVAFADELRDKYGDDIPIDAALINEILELGRKLFKC